MSPSWLFALLLQTPAPPPSCDARTYPLLTDRTGIEWTVPFKAAVAKAREERRLLLLKPIAFGTTKQGGW
jgi:hypothetical protein